MKGLRFRNIAPKAPKAPAVASTPAVLSCPTPSALPDAALAVSPKSVLKPTQNYALMQVVGQEGTFSLVPLPSSVSSPAPQSIVHKSPSFPRNLKLPIPRYQPAQSKSTPEKALPAATRAVPRTHTPGPLDCPSKAELLEKVMPIESGSSEISVTTLLSDSTVLQKMSVEDGGEHLACVPSETLASMASLDIRVQEEGSRSRSSSKPSDITVLSPAIFSKAVQIVVSPPKGKLPIPPYSKVKHTLSPPAKMVVMSPERSFPGARCSLVDSTDLVPEACKDLDSLLALQKPAGKKRGRKRKTLEDILAFEARKKRSLSFFRRRAPEKTSLAAGLKDGTLDICKKYRTIRPKPVLVLETAPQLLGLSSLSTSKGLEQEVLMGLPSNMLNYRHPEPISERASCQRGVGGGVGNVCLSGQQPHCCTTCGRCFQFKHHLQSHMNSHTNSRPYACPACRKAYAHSGSLSTHMKLHHGDGRRGHGRPRKPLHCEFCEKSFGYVGVYFAHLKEVHKIVLTLEPFVSQRKDNIRAEGLMPVDSGDGQTQGEEASVVLQIKCGRCQATTPTFSDMKLHLVCVHGEEAQAQSREGGGQAEDQLARHAARHWWQLSERRNPVRCGRCGEEFFSFSRLRRHMYSYHRGEPEVTAEHVETPLPGPSHGSAVVNTRGAYHCVLCAACLDSKEKLLEHWGGRHNCEDPPTLWAILNSLVKHDSTDRSCLSS